MTVRVLAFPILFGVVGIVMHILRIPCEKSALAIVSGNVQTIVANPKRTPSETWIVALRFDGF